MSKLREFVGRELPLLRQYAVGVRDQWEKIVGSAAVVGLLWVLGEFGAAVLAQIPKYAPDTIDPWLTRNRLIWLSVVAVLIIAQYVVWRAAWLTRGTPEKPYLAKGLQKITQSVSRSSSSSPAPELTTTRFELTAEHDLRGKAIRITCDNPIYNAYFSMYANPGIRAYGEDIVKDETTSSIVFDFGGQRIAERPFTVIAGHLNSTIPLRILRIDWADLTPKPHRGY